MAQPLTILQSRLEAAILLCEEGGDPELLGTLGSEVERLCGLYHALRHLVAIQSPSDGIPAMDPHEVLSSVIEEVTPIYADAGVLLLTERKPALASVKLAAPLLQEIVFAVLLAARAAASPGDRVELCSTASSNAIVIEVRNLSPRQQALSAQVRLSLATAEAKMLTQQADFLQQADPFLVRMRLPIAADS